MSRPHDVEEIRLSELRPRLARSLLATGAPVWILANPVEHHGPHLSPHNDRLIARELVRGVARRLTTAHGWPLVWGNDLEAGVGPVPGPGSQPVPFDAVATALTRAATAVAAFGATRVGLVTFHGDPRHNLAIQRAVARFEALGVRAAAPTAWLMGEIVHLDPTALDEVYATVDDEPLRRAMARDARLDLHAGFLETSLSLWYAPETVGEHAAVAPAPAIVPDRQVRALAAAARAAGRAGLAAELDHAAVALGWLALRPFPGYTGRPSLANERAGELLAAHFEARYAAICEAVFAGVERSPRPPFAWLDPTAPAAALARAAVARLPGRDRG